MENILSLITILFYGLAMIFIVPSLLNAQGVKTKLIFTCATIALIGHAWLLNDLIFSSVGQNLSILNVASLIGFISCFVMTIAMLKVRVWFLLPIVYSFSIINIIASTFLPGTFLTHFEGRPELLFHITIALFSYSTLMIGALFAIQLAWLDGQIRNKKSPLVNPNFPPLLMVERQLFKITLIGTILLTITLITGVVYIQGSLSSENAHKTILSFIAWIIYVSLLWGHYNKGWRGKKALWLSIAATLLLTLGYFGSRFVREVILS